MVAAWVAAVIVTAVTQLGERVLGLFNSINF